MIRINHKSDFALRLVFSDADGLPVSMKDVDLDLWLSTRPGGPVFFAAQRRGICNACSVLDDGSLLVAVDDHHLPPGQLAADLALHADDGSMADGRRDIRLKPAIPVELVEGGAAPVCRAHHHGQTASPVSEPVIVNIKLPASKPSLSRHVSFREFDAAVTQIREEISLIKPCDMSIASDEDINSISNLFIL